MGTTHVDRRSVTAMGYLVLLLGIALLVVVQGLNSPIYHDVMVRLIAVFVILEVFLIGAMIWAAGRARKEKTIRQT